MTHMREISSRSCIFLALPARVMPPRIQVSLKPFRIYVDFIHLSGLSDGRVAAMVIEALVRRAHVSSETSRSE